MKLPRVLFVTGKGGTGKSTVAAALALALAERRPTTLADLGGDLGAANLLGAISAGDSLSVIGLSPRAELNSFIRRIVPVAAISERMLRSRTFGYVTAALPGLEAFLLLERLRMMGGEAALNDCYVAIDAPASGTALELLAVATGIKGVAPAGTLNRLANEVQAFLSDRARFGVLLTITPEELALREALDTARALRGMGIHIVGSVVNRSPQALFSEGELQRLDTLTAHRRLAEKRFAEQAALETARKKLKSEQIAIFQLPMLYRAVLGPREIADLSQELGTVLGAE